MSRRPFLPCWVVVAALVGATWSGAVAIYINPDASITAATFPAVGKLGNANDFLCTGTIIENTIVLPGTSPAFALTANHCTYRDPGNAGDPQPYADTSGRYDVSGAGTTVLTTSQIRRRPGWQTGQGAQVSDIGLFRFGSPITGVAPMDLLRTGRWDFNTQATLVGFGRGNPATNGGAYGTKRQADFTADGQVNGIMPFTTNNGGPRPCLGDSGGPLFSGGKIAGILSAGATATCDGTASVAGAALVDKTPLSYVQANVNWIDSYTRKGIFWDELKINGNVGNGDRFEEFQSDLDPAPGLANGWKYAQNVTHPTLGGGNPIPNTGFRYFDAIGKTNTNSPELYTEGNAGQAEIATAGNALSVMSKDFAMTFDGDGSASISIQQGWNSLGLVTDVGYKLAGDAAITWLGVQDSTMAAGSVATWSERTRTIQGPANQATTITIYLLNGTPEPGTAGLMMLGALMLRSRRCRNGAASSVKSR